MDFKYKLSWWSSEAVLLYKEIASDARMQHAVRDNASSFVRCHPNAMREKHKE